MLDLRAQPWWTEADESELDLLAEELVRSVFAHRERCSTCRAGERCSKLAPAFKAVFEWRQGRILRSKAAWLRARQTLAEEAA